MPKSTASRPLPAAARRRLTDGSVLTYLPDGSQVRRLNGAHLVAEHFAEQAASGELTDGNGHPVPTDATIVVDGISSRDVQRARQQVRDAAAVQQIKRAATTPHSVPRVIRRSPAARRPGAKRTTASRAGPDDGDGEPEPPAGVVGGARLGGER